MLMDGTLVGACIKSWLLGFFGLPCVIPSNSDDPIKENPDWFRRFPPTGDVEDVGIEIAEGASGELSKDLKLLV
jgi:hypothetical protein